MNRIAIASTLLCFALTTTLWADDRHVIQFDLPPVVAATPSPEQPDEPSLVTIALPLSSMIVSPSVPTIDQWLVRCQPRDTNMAVADYAPRTETASDLVSPIQVKNVEEKNQAFGFSVDAKYPPVALGHAGADHARKNVDSVEFSRHAPVQAVSAAGTINRGRGVYFKLRWTSRQVLEGEKIFQITFAVPPTWRGSLIDVSVIAQAERKIFGGLDREVQTLGTARFVVAAYRLGDPEAASAAQAFAESEFALRQVAARHASDSVAMTLPSMLRHVARKFDLDDSPGDQWLSRLLLGTADPHLDKHINRLPMPVRIAALDYSDCRDHFTTLGDHTTPETTPDRIVTAKPPMR